MARRFFSESADSGDFETKESVVEVNNKGVVQQNSELADALTEIDEDTDYQLRLEIAYEMLQDGEFDADELCDMYDLELEDLENFVPAEDDPDEIEEEYQEYDDLNDDDD